ncbi:MAG TPA: hypothetical protein ENJ00_09985 [Phycisphaerales bacterium]|nr:hypothetical protein [Phycisphaerales bacterium]
MSTPRNPGETFLGASVVNDPFALLGLPRRPVDDQTVLAALGARMEGVAKHPRSQTPEANELRLALHAAAAQLLDAQVQELLLSEPARESERPQVPIPGQPMPNSKPSPILAAVGLSHDVLMVVAANGGWNQRAMRRLAQIAHARGIPSAEIPTAVISVLGGFTPNVATEPAIGGQESRPRPRSGSLTPTIPNVSSRKRSSGSLVPIILSILTISTFILIWVRLTEPKPKQQALPAPSAVNDAEQPIQPLITDEQAASPPKDETHYSSVEAAQQIVDLASLRQPLSDDEMKAFQLAHSALAEGWIELGSDQVSAVHNAIVELLYAHAMTPERAQRFVASIAKAYRPNGTDRAALASTVWAVGTLTRLSQERNLPTAIDSAIVGRLAGVLGDGVRSAAKSFREGAIAASQIEAEMLADSDQPAKVWMDWLRVLGAAVGADPERREQEILRALETVLITGKEPTASRAAYKTIETLARELTLEPKSRTADVVIGWFADDRISAADLTAVMRPLVQGSLTEGIDQSLIPANSATEPQRMAIRQRLQTVLQGKGDQQDWPGTQWLKLTESELAKPVPTSAAGHVARVVSMSRLSSAAHAILWGDDQAAEFIVANLHDDTNRLLAVKVTPVSALGGDGSLDWATRYLNARQNIPIREALLGELTRGNHTLGPVAAELVIKEAFLGTPATIRRQAQDVARLHRSSPAIVNAMLEYLPRAPHVQSVSDLIETIARTRLPATDNPAWAYRVRKATVERLLELITGVGQGEIVDQLVALLAQSYDARLTGSTGTSTGDSQTLELAAEGLYQSWHDRADEQIADIRLRSELESLDHRLIGRLTLARGTLERFAAYQVSAVEAAGLLIRAEQPAQSGQVEAVIENLTERRRSADNVLEQLVASEETMVRLWQIRLEGSTP